MIGAPCLKHSHLFRCTSKAHLRRTSHVCFELWLCMSGLNVAYIRGSCGSEMQSKTGSDSVCWAGWPNYFTISSIQYHQQLGLPQTKMITRLLIIFYSMSSTNYKERALKEETLKPWKKLRSQLSLCWSTIQDFYVILYYCIAFYCIVLNFLNNKSKYCYNNNNNI